MISLTILAGLILVFNAGLALANRFPHGGKLRFDDDAGSLFQHGFLARPPYESHQTGETIDPNIFKCTVMGYFPYPRDCTRYIYCTPELIAMKQLCPVCNSTAVPEQCPEGRQYFDKNTDECAPDVVCPPPDPTTTTTPTPELSTPKPGTSCDPKCLQFGDCNCYYSCVRNPDDPTTGTWEQRFCGDGLYWNVNSTIHGGTCDFFANLPPWLQLIYRNDGTCPTDDLPCKFGPDESCPANYYYYPDRKNDSVRQLLKCPKSPEGRFTFWDQEAENCLLACPKPSPNYTCEYECIVEE